MAHVLTHRVRYHEADAQGFLFNSRFLELTDVAMTEFFRGLGWPYRELVAGGTDPSLVTAQLDFERPAKFEDLLDLDVRCEHVGRSSFRLKTCISRAGELVAIVTITYVNVDAHAATPRPLPTSVADALRASVHDATATSATESSMDASRQAQITRPVIDAPDGSLDRRGRP